MKLLYLYIEDYGCIKNQEFYFDSQYHFHFDKSNPEKWVLNEDKVENPLPDNFWTSSSGKHNVVESVSVIIGENGSGKTTLARFIGQEIGTKGEKQLELENSTSTKNKSQKDKYKYVSIFFLNENEKNWKKEDYLIISNIEIYFHGSKNPSEINIDLNLFLSLQGLELPKLVYYSPHYTTEHLIDPTLIIDLSTSRCLAKGPNTRTANYQKFTNKNSISVTLAHEYYEYMGVLKFIRNNNKTKITKDIPLPKKIIISPETDQIPLLKNLYKQLIEEVTDIQETDENSKKLFQHLYKQVIQMLNKIHTADCFIVSFVCYITCYCIDHLYDAVNIIVQHENEFFYDELEKIFKYINFAKLICQRLPASPDIDTIEKYHEKILTFIKKIKKTKRLFLNEYVFFSKLEEIYKNNLKDKKNEMPLKLLNCSCSAASRIIEEYNRCFSFTNFLSVSFYPHLSSGEMAFLTMFSRIYNSLMIEQKNHDNFILFLDEVETTLHPEWQRRLVLWIINFFEDLAINKKVQIIFASHSPILLSDIPDSNVVFLKKNKDTGYTEVVNHKETGKTFAANIHTLLAKSFFLNKTIGEFASQYIEKTCEMIEAIQDISTLKENLIMINQRIDTVAEEFIRIGLQRNLYRKIESLKTLDNKNELIDALQHFIDELEEEK